MRSGWTAGAGVELPVSPAVTVKFEYLYVDFGTVSFNNGVFSNEVGFQRAYFAGWNEFQVQLISVAAIIDRGRLLRARLSSKTTAAPSVPGGWRKMRPTTRPFPPSRTS